MSIKLKNREDRWIIEELKTVVKMVNQLEKE